MAKRIACFTAALLLVACVQHALALGSVEIVTKETQAKSGLVYTLTAERVDKEAVLVSMEISKTGKLKDLRSVSMRVGTGRPAVFAPLQTRPGKDGSLIASFQLSPELADRCSIDLNVPVSGRTYVIYAVELTGYVTDRK